MSARSRILAVAVAFGVSACGGGDAGSAADADAQAADTAAATGVSASDAPMAGPVVLELVPERSEARYRVREQLVNLDLPNDAVGVTSDVSGRIAFDGEGAVIPDASSITVEVAGFQSDRDRRDGYVRGRLLLAEEYPTVELRPTAVNGLTFPLPRTGTRTFEIVGDLTVLDVTRPTTWEVTANFNGEGAEGTAVTRFSFDDFQLTQPRVPVVLSVADTIALELDFAVTAVEGSGTAP
jgi:polyisoprenoid-binding protein YceI